MPYDEDDGSSDDFGGEYNAKRVKRETLRHQYKPTSPSTVMSRAKKTTLS